MIIFSLVSFLKLLRQTLEIERCRRLLPITPKRLITQKQLMFVSMLRTLYANMGAIIEILQMGLYC